MRYSTSLELISDSDDVPWAILPSYFTTLDYMNKGYR
jgi:hypothetical protein